jgi:hypothetical protein
MNDGWRGLRDLFRSAEHAGARRVSFDGVEWMVYERGPDLFDRRRSPSLIFESQDTIRRVRTYPRNWAELPDEELARLSWGR